MKTQFERGARLASACLVAGVVAASIAQAAPPTQIVVTGEKIFPESMTSTADGSVIIGSIAQRMIFRAKPMAATAEAWIQPGTDDMQSIFGVFADNKSNTLWACSASFGPPNGPPRPPSALYAFNLKTGESKGHYPFPTPGAFCNDIAVGPDGTAYATDTNNMEVVRLKKGAKELEVWSDNGAFGPKGGILDGISVLGKRVLVNTLATSKLFSVPIESDGNAGTVAEVQLDRPIQRPDGMRSFGKNSLLVVEGGNGGRLSIVKLSGDTGKATTLKEGYPDGPVAVTVVGTTGYVLEGQLASLMGRGPPAANAAPKPFRATAVEVGKP